MKSWVVFRFRSLLAVAAVAVLTAVACLAVVSVKKSVAASQNGIVIVLDAGHGGMDGGVVGKTSGVKESDINLSLTKMLKHALSKRGYAVYLTRNTSAGLYDLTATNKKLSDMQKRKQIICEKKPHLMISIHHNRFPDASVHGAQVFYSDFQEQSKAYAQIFQQAFNSALEQNKTCKQADYYVLQCSPYPSVLLECGFLSNPQEEKKLIDPVYREKLANILANAVDAVFFPSSSAK